MHRQPNQCNEMNEKEEHTSPVVIASHKATFSTPSIVPRAL